MSILKSSLASHVTDLVLKPSLLILRPANANNLPINPLLVATRYIFAKSGLKENLLP